MFWKYAQVVPKEVCVQEVLSDQRSALSDLLQQLLKQKGQREVELQHVLVSHLGSAFLHWSETEPSTTEPISIASWETCVHPNPLICMCVCLCLLGRDGEEERVKSAELLDDPISETAGHQTSVTALAGAQ